MLETEKLSDFVKATARSFVCTGIVTVKDTHGNVSLRLAVLN